MHSSVRRFQCGFGALMGRGKPDAAHKPSAAVLEPWQVLQCQGEHSVITQVNALEKRLFSKAFALTGR